MKNALIILLGGAAVYLLYKAYVNSQPSQLQSKPQVQSPEQLSSVTCPEGEILCSDGKNCYNPSAKYIVNPCSN